MTANLTIAPGGRTQPAIAYDPDLGKVVLFGGYDVSVAADGDTWEFSNNSWTDITGTLSVSPPARWGGAMVWDPALAALVLFGGRDVTSYYNDTWAFNGTAWSQIATTGAPLPRAQFQLAYDPVDAVVLLQGGDWRNLSSSVITWHYLDDIWSFQSGVWTNLTSSYTPAPGVRGLGQAAYDPWNRSVVEVGGLTSGVASGCTPAARVATLVSNRTYEYPAGTGPGEIAQEMMTYVPDGPYLLLFGGYANSTLGCAQVNATWVRVDGQWVNITGVSASAPSIRYLGGIAYDAAENEVVLFGGNGAGVYLGDTWTFTTPAVAVSVAANRTGGVGPLSVAFAATVTGGSEGGYSYNWSFGDGTTANGSGAVTHQFSRTGTFIVRLNVTDLLNRSSSATTSIVVVPPLVATPSASNPVGSVPLTEVFHANPVGGQSPFSGRWSFGDGTSATGVNASHTYTVAGSYQVNLSLADAFGDRATGNLTITLAPTLTADIVGGVRIGVAPFTSDFGANLSGGNPPYTYSWNFGDGNTSPEAAPSHVFSVAGVYDVRLVVQDSFGRNASASTQVTVVVPLTAALYSSATRGVSPLPVDFTLQPTGGVSPFTVTWTFGDGASGNGPNVTHVFRTTGNHTVVANVTDALGNQASAAVVVQVVLPLGETLTANSTVAEEPDGFTFGVLTAGGAAPYNWTWSMGDGASAWGPGPVVHTYRTPGAYLVRLTITDGLGEKVQDSLGVTVKAALNATVAASTATPWVGNVTNFTVTTVGGEAPFAYFWSNLPIGCAAGDAAALSCQPAAPGSFTVTVLVRDALNHSVVRTVSVDVVPVPPSLSSPGAGEGDALILAGVVVVVAAGVGALVWVMRRGRPPTAAVPSSNVEPYDADSMRGPTLDGEPYLDGRDGPGEVTPTPPPDPFQS